MRASPHPPEHTPQAPVRPFAAARFPNAAKDGFMFKRKKRDKLRHFSHGAGGAMADAASEVSPHAEEHRPDAPSSRQVKPLRENEKPDQLAEKEAASEDRE